MLEKIKLSMRIFHTMLDLGIIQEIETCMLDMRRVGVSSDVATIDSEDALIVKAAELYCKWQNDFNGKGEQFQKAYENLRDALSLCDDYAKRGNADV